MAVRLESDGDGNINANDMRDGDMAVITQWTVRGYNGRIVQRWKNHLISVGLDGGRSWDDFFTQARNESCRVRLLKPGAKLIVD